MQKSVEAAAPNQASTTNLSGSLGHPLAYPIDDKLPKIIGFGRSKIYEELKGGRIKGKKVGRRTIILHADLVAYLENLPERTA